MRRSSLLSLEKSLRTQEVCTAIGQQLREHYNVSQSPSDRLADLVKKIEQSNHGVPRPQDDRAESQTTDLKEQS